MEITAPGGVDSFTITPDKGITDVVSIYNATVNSTVAITSLNITIPKGFGVANETMQAGNTTAKVELFNATADWYGNVTLVANATEPTNQVDVLAWVGSDSKVSYGIYVNYSTGGTTTIQSPWGGGSVAELKMPTDTANGSLNVSLPASADIRNATINIRQFVRNPAVADNYVFTANGFESNTVEILAVALDLNITEIWVGWPDNCTIFYNVTNIGTVNATAGHNTTLYVDGNEKALDKVPVNLTPGGSYIGNFSASYTWKYTPTWDNITVCADINGTVDESDETNNCLTNIWMCGDVDGNGVLTTPEAYNVYFAAAYSDLSYVNSIWAADVDGNGVLTTPEAYNVYFAAAYSDPLGYLSCACE